jgi:CRISPR-associated endonuclease/helicase Cas3
VRLARHAALTRWLAAQLGALPPPASGPRLWERARDTFATLVLDWTGPVTPDDGLIAELMQGAVTLADRSASAHVRFQCHMSAPFGFLGRIPGAYPHQRAAGTPTGRWF